MPFPFANPILLWGLPAAAIPIIIHLLNRRRHRVVDWGAMRFLDLSYVTRHRRIRLEELLLLLLRTAMLLVIVLALARPFLVGGLFGAGQSRRDLVIVLDSSMSMNYRDGARTSFSRGAELARQVAGALSQGDGFDLVHATQEPRALFPELTYDLETAGRAMEDLKTSRASLDMVKSLKLALAILKGGTSPLKQIVVITDGQRFGWSADDASAWKAVADDLAGLSVKPQIIVATVPPSGPTVNASVAQVELSRDMVGTDREVGLQVRVHNFSARDLAGRRLRVLVDEAPKADLDLATLPARGELVLPFTHLFTQTGPHVVTAELDDDALPDDNVAHFGLEVLDSFPVLLVDGEPGQAPAESELCYLRAALDPLDPTSRTRRNLVSAGVVEPGRLGEKNLSRYSAVVLANVDRLPNEQVLALEHFVRNGGGLLIAPGEHIDRDFYDQVLFAGGRGLLPTALADPIGDARARTVSVSMMTTGLTHKALQVFNDPNKADLSKARFYRHWRLSGLRPEAIAALLLADGDPLLVEQRFGSGRVMLMTVPVDADWSNLPLRANYVTLMQELISYLASPTLTSRNLLVGQTLSIDLDSAVSGSVPAPDKSLQKVTVTGPTGQKRTADIVKRDGRTVALYPHTDQAGLYQVEILAAGRGGATAPAETFTCVVNVDPAESDLTALAADSRSILTDRTGIRFLADSATLSAVVFAGSLQFELWPYLAVLVLTMLVGEVLFTRALAGRKDALAIEFVNGQTEPSPRQLEGARR